MQHLVKIQLFETKISLASGYYGLELSTWKHIDSKNKFLLTYSATFEVKTYKIKSVGQFQTALFSNFVCNDLFVCLLLDSCVHPLIGRIFFSTCLMQPSSNWLIHFCKRYCGDFYVSPVLTNPRSKSRSDLGFSLKSDFLTTNPPNNKQCTRKMSWLMLWMWMIPIY